MGFKNNGHFRCKHKESAPTSAIMRLTSAAKPFQDQRMIPDVEQDHQQQQSHLQQQNVPKQQDFIKFVPPVIQIYDQHLALINILA